METFLQSKEVKIPKPNQANKVQVSPIDFKSSFARSLSNNNREDEEILKLSFSGEDSVQTQKTKVNNNRSIDVLKMTCDKNSHFKKIDCGEKTIIEYSDESFNRSDEDKLLWTVDQQVVKEDMKRKNHFDLIYIPHFFSFSFSLLLSHDPNKNSILFWRRTSCCVHIVSRLRKEERLFQIKSNLLFL